MRKEERKRKKQQQNTAYTIDYKFIFFSSTFDFKGSQTGQVNSLRMIFKYIIYIF